MSLSLRWFLLLISCCLATSVQASGSGNPARGHVVAQVRCFPCHHFDSRAYKVGPSLNGVYLRAPSISQVPFDRWDEASLTLWLENPRKIKPNTKMLLPHLSEQDRKDIIAWLASRDSDQTYD